jgi:NAD(P)-dependent dehydrogenase (short-subunit alcohol dehydrogenase family)
MIEGKVMLVTGGTRGIGQGTAIRMAEYGAKVAITGRDDVGGETVEMIEKAGGECLFIQSDVSVEADIERAVAETVARFGRLDGAFNNAGIGALGGPFVDLQESDFDAMFSVNVKGIFFSMQQEIRQFLKQGSGGAIVNCSSVYGHVAVQGSGHYTATKHAMEGYTKVAALDYAAQNIRINSMAPGLVSEGRLGAGGLEQEFQAELMAKHPMGRFATALDCAEAAIFLLSDKAAFTTGTSLLVDGGYVAE